MRGKAINERETVCVPRITPAYAGKSRISGTACEACRDHPRLCGEKSAAALSESKKPGSPPPMRGKAHGLIVVNQIRRITPAYAGKSGCLCHSLNGSKDHPRLCGEKTKKILKQRYFFHQPASFSFSLQYT